MIVNSVWFVVCWKVGEYNKMHYQLWSMLYDSAQREGYSGE